MTTLQEPTIDEIRTELDQVRAERDLFKAQLNKAEAAINTRNIQLIKFVAIIQNLSQALAREPRE